MNRPKTVKTLYKYVKDNEDNLLPDMSEVTAEGFEWWQDLYTSESYEAIDELFSRLYLSYIFYDRFGIDFVEDYTDANALESFHRAVLELFFKNKKKYSELYRVETIPDNEAYALTNNYDIHETYSGTNATQGSAITGQRTDVTIDEIGSQSSSGLNKVTGWNSAAENTDNSNAGTIGNREDTHQFTKGQEQDTSRSQGQDAHTLRRYGNAGVMTVDDIIRKFKDNWLPWSFLQIIFDDICREYLLIGDDRICW